MLQKFTATNYRNLRLNELPLKRINILIGPNNSGKTNLIDAVGFLSHVLLSERKDSGFLSEIALRGWDDILRRASDRPAQINLKWVFTPDQEYHDLCYDISFQIDKADQPPRGFFITHEQLRYEQPAEGHASPYNFFLSPSEPNGKGAFSAHARTEGKPRTIYLDVDPRDTVFRQVTTLLEDAKFRTDVYPTFMKAVQKVKSYFEGYYSYSSTYLRLDTLREPVKFEMDSTQLGRDGSNFVNVLSFLDKQYDFLDTYTESLRELIHGLSKVKVLHRTQTNVDVELRIDNSPFKLKEMSDGTLKAMLLNLLLHTPERVSLLSLDEPEVNLHPAWLKVVARWILTSSSADQIFISTHSPDLLDGFTEAFQQGEVNLLVGSLSSDQTIIPAHLDQVSNFLNDGWELGDLYRVGEPLLGGWPW